MPKIIKNNYNLILVKPSNVKELTNALLQVTEDPEVRNNLSKNLKDLNNYLSWQSISKEIRGLYAQLY